ncbi:MAG TPA: 4-hydroxy-3-methylbut-2-enyl diphosphate reductase [Spirochaetota bacterium]|mgnify:CR=1 FL=1|nr:4-hydroxy-3-methylbut-2-enyl diphosphate reductase [Spirochaetota bacterium]HOD14192.1 4-hydroxy-3-methylbut-2-enyl diphosphate reductase [Spirochaetota bacterium]HPG50887.1 4-hydroxy-3-methylbut-2-enyl diphosphate reductase [Spirochaetota bacterium]HPN13105.1 4-hydroxy-3-methylbut-2-enyl diphosphate reductase [Spirochaetota bacterium]
MKITLARHSGFCMGVRNAVLRIISEINSTDENLYVYGPLIHNPQTVDVLHGRGLSTINSLDAIANRRIAIRTHGIPVDELRMVKQCASRVINLTCPRVARVQSIIKKHSAGGSHTIITGDRDHAEVIGLMSYAAHGVSVISDLPETDSIPPADSYILVSQTTFDRELYKRIVSRVQSTLKNVTVFDTICDSTRLRQEDVVVGITAGTDTLVVVGGKNSANTRRLAQIGRDSGIATFHIETEDELQEKDFSGSRNVLVTAGTSTPGWIINNILEKIYTIKYMRSNIFVRAALFMLEFIVRTNILSAIAAYFITLFTMLYTGLPDDHALAAVSLLYIFSIYSTNNYFEKKFLKLSNPYKYRIYRRFGLPLLIASIISMAVSIIISLRYGTVPTMVITGSYLMGFIYSTAPVKLMVKKMKAGIIRRLYNSKLVTCFGWIIVTVLLPQIALATGSAAPAALSFLVFGLIFLRTAILDLIAYQGDLILGRETLPIWIGTANTRTVSTTAGALGVLVFSVITVLTASPLYLLPVLNIVYFLLLMSVINRLNYLIALKYELLVDVNFILLILFYFILRLT